MTISDIKGLRDLSLARIRISRRTESPAKYLTSVYGARTKQCGFPVRLLPRDPSIGMEGLASEIICSKREAFFNERRYFPLDEGVDEAYDIYTTRHSCDTVLGVSLIEFG